MYVITTWAEPIHAVSDRKDITRCGLRYYQDARPLPALPINVPARDLCLRGCFPTCPICDVAIRTPRLMAKHIALHLDPIEFVAAAFPRDDEVA